jgi:hypothetical protein
MKNIIISVALFLASLCSHTAFAAVHVVIINNDNTPLYAGHPVTDAELLPPALVRRPEPVAAMEDRYSHLPEPHIASMLFLGLILIVLTVQEEKDEKFHN